jgi:hypothetical protein
MIVERDAKKPTRAPAGGQTYDHLVRGPLASSQGSTDRFSVAASVK